MKRLAWLMLLAFGTLLTQVPAVEPLTVPAKQSCACGEKCAGRCHMPACALPAAPATPQLASDQTTSLVRPAARRDARRDELADRFPLFVSRVTPDASPALRAPAGLAPAAIAPLFKAHCSFLL